MPRHSPLLGLQCDLRGINSKRTPTRIRVQKLPTRNHPHLSGQGAVTGVEDHDIDMQGDDPHRQRLWSIDRTQHIHSSARWLRCASRTRLAAITRKSGSSTRRGSRMASTTASAKLWPCVMTAKGLRLASSEDSTLSALILSNLAGNPSSPDHIKGNGPRKDPRPLHHSPLHFAALLALRASLVAR